MINNVSQRGLDDTYPTFIIRTYGEMWDARNLGTVAPDFTQCRRSRLTDAQRRHRAKQKEIAKASKKRNR